MSDYQAVQNKILEICKEVRFLDLDSFLSQINQAETVASMVDPTMYRAAMGNLQVVKESAEALKLAQKKLPSMDKIIDGAMSAQEYRGGDL